LGHFIILFYPSIPPLPDGACENGTPRRDYNNKVPLSPFVDWAKGHGYSYKYYDYNLQGNSKEKYSKNISDFMINDPSSEFILVGHSAGADAVVWAASRYLQRGGQPSNILGVMALDMGLDVNYDQAVIDSIIEKGVPVKAFHSQDYSVDTQPLDSTSVDPDCLTGLWINTLERLRRQLGWDGTNFHRYLAVDQAGFDKYMKPVLEDWSK
jgi:pimeloyl-ACP methyl ester carboxylesterase